MSSMKKILFVCLGNICRSPLAEGVFSHLADQKGLDVQVDSAGTSAFHIGEAPDHRMRQTALKNGISLTSRSRQILPQDGQEFDYIFAMDQSNYRDILRILGPSVTAQVALFRDFDPAIEGKADVPDPYYGGLQGFEEVYQIVYRTCEAIQERLIL